MTRAMLPSPQETVGRLATRLILEAEDHPFPFPDMEGFIQDLKAKGVGQQDAIDQTIKKFQGRSWRHTISAVMWGVFVQGVSSAVDYVYGRE